MLQEIIHRRDAGTHAQAASAAINQRRQAPQQSCGPQGGCQRIGQAGPRFVWFQIHGDGVESIDVAGGVVYSRGKGNCVGAAVGKSQEYIGADISDGRSESTKISRLGAVLQGVIEAGKVGERSGAGLVQGSSS